MSCLAGFFDFLFRRLLTGDTGRRVRNEQITAPNAGYVSELPADSNQAQMANLQGSLSDEAIERLDRENYGRIGALSSSGCSTSDFSDLSDTGSDNDDDEEEGERETFYDEDVWKYNVGCLRGGNRQSPSPPPPRSLPRKHTAVIEALFHRPSETEWRDFQRTMIHLGFSMMPPDNGGAKRRFEVSARSDLFPAGTKRQVITPRTLRSFVGMPQDNCRHWFKKGLEIIHGSFKRFPSFIYTLPSRARTPIMLPPQFFSEIQDIPGTIGSKSHATSDVECFNYRKKGDYKKKDRVIEIQDEEEQGNDSDEDTFSEQEFTVAALRQETSPEPDTTGCSKCQKSELRACKYHSAEFKSRTAIELGSTYTSPPVQFTTATTTNKQKTTQDTNQPTRLTTANLKILAIAIEKMKERLRGPVECTQTPRRAEKLY
ncbi:hypothetical protein EV127DRAFT_499816 [Xylaria flabelliformis]|nr:hypothetical protein EV127DRAFT_499816 [Xylaria flabelliformis]